MKRGKRRGRTMHEEIQQMLGFTTQSRMWQQIDEVGVKTIGIPKRKKEVITKNGLRRIEQG